MNEQDYLKMQKAQYEQDASQWTLKNRDPVVGSYDAHNTWADYDTQLFRGIDTKGKVALEYGCGPGRNIIKYSPIFKWIVGVDIASTNLEKALVNTHANQVTNFSLQLCDGKSIPEFFDGIDIVFSVICLQHIASYDIRNSIFKDVYRVLKPEGYFCFQMGYGGRNVSLPTAEYHDNAYDAKGTNSLHDVTVRDPKQLEDNLREIGFRTFDYVLRPTGPGDAHAQWIWVQAQK